MQGPAQTLGSGGRSWHQKCQFLYHSNVFILKTVVVGGMSECWVRPPSVAHRGQHTAHGIFDSLKENFSRSIAWKFSHRKNLKQRYFFKMALSEGPGSPIVC